MKEVELHMRDGQLLRWRADQIDGFVIGVDHIALYTSRDHVFHIAVNDRNQQSLLDWSGWLRDHREGPDGRE